MNPDFFLGSSEHSGDWSRARSCQVAGKVTDAEEREYLWVKIDPPVIGQPYGLGDKDITDVLLLPHLQGTSLFPISEFPLPVYIYRVLDEQVFRDSRALPSNLTMAAWGELYATREEADRAKQR